MARRLDCDWLMIVDGVLVLHARERTHSRQERAA